jgi:hypothetical protein
MGRRLGQYLLFGSSASHGRGGWNDFIDSYGSVSEAKLAGEVKKLHSSRFT